MSPEDLKILQDRINKNSIPKKERESYADKALASSPYQKVAKVAVPKTGMKEDKGAANKRKMEDVIKRFYPRYKQDYFKEFIFADTRKFRFDFYIPELKLGIEYDGLFSEKSRHTTCTGFTKDCEKMNLATILGFKVLRYTPMNIDSIGNDLEQLKHPNLDVT